MSNTRLSAIVLLLMVAVVVMPGCDSEMGWWNWFDPSKPIKAPKQGMINPIFTQVGATDRTEEMVPNAAPPMPADLRYAEKDYIIGPTDMLRVSVLDLLQDGQEMPMDRQVSHSGYIDLLLGVKVKATGLTKDELTERIKQAYQPDILKEANVSVTILAPRQNVFSVLGAVQRPGTYGILRRHFTLLEALALCGDVNQVNIPWIYIYRPAEGAEQMSPSSIPTELAPLPTIPEASPTVESGVKPAISPDAPAEKKTPSRQEKLDELARSIAGGGVPADTEPSTGGTTTTADKTVKPVAPPVAMHKWVYSNGRWVSVPMTTADKAKELTPGAPGKSEDDKFGWGKYDMSKMSRIIAIDLPRLKAGDPSVNVIIRDHDVIHIPTLEVGEFYVMGEVLRPGVYSLTGRRVTAKMAVAAAGNLGPLAWPNNSILIRRIGRDKEQTIPLKLQDIFHGREPDIFLKPNDVIAVGSYWAATPLAVWRNAFRMTYGFGFIYDRNFSEFDFEIPGIMPNKGLR